MTPPATKFLIKLGPIGEYLEMKLYLFMKISRLIEKGHITIKTVFFQERIETKLHHNIYLPTLIYTGNSPNCVNASGRLFWPRAFEVDGLA